jgi:adenosylcobinamide-GDP ribazoletransferase
MNFLKRLALTASYVTCIPLGVSFDTEDETMLHGLSKFLPLVGLFIGLLLTLIVFVLTQFHLSSLMLATIITFKWLWITGGLHMDGLMDTADGFFSHRSRERMLEIMQDSRVGNFAVLVAITVIALKIVALQSLNLSTLIVAVLLIPGWARACEVYAIGKFDYAREQGKGKIWHDTTIWPRDLFLSIIPIMLATACIYQFNPKAVIQVTVATIIGGVISAHLLNAKLNGHTGDTYGAVVEIAEMMGVFVTAINL